MINENWIENTTGVCPFKNEPDTLIDVKYRNGKILEDVAAQGSFFGVDTSPAFWCIDGVSCDIVAYRVRPNADGWIKNTGVYPADGDAELEIRFFGECGTYDSCAGTDWRWSFLDRDECDIEYWRYKNQPAVAAVPVPLTLAQQVEALAADNAQLYAEAEDVRQEITFLKGKLDAIKGLF